MKKESEDNKEMPPGISLDTTPSKPRRPSFEQLESVCIKHRKTSRSSNTKQQPKAHKTTKARKTSQHKTSEPAKQDLMTMAKVFGREDAADTKPEDVLAMAKVFESEDATDSKTEEEASFARYEGEYAEAKIHIPTEVLMYAHRLRHLYKIAEKMSGMNVSEDMKQRSTAISEQAAVEDLAIKWAYEMDEMMMSARGFDPSSSESAEE